MSDVDLYLPRATYRLQFNSTFTFDDARALVPYLADLGVSHLYASPYLKAREGSTHGYDIVDHNSFNPEIGSEDSFRALSAALGDHGLGQILDFVPNHMGIGRADNAWWLDVLEWGEESPYAEYFDIDWSSAKPELRGKVLLPVLGNHYGHTLEGGELKLAFDADDGSFSVWYYEHRFPVTPGQYTRILRPVAESLNRDERLSDDEAEALEVVVSGFRDLTRRFRSPRDRATRRRQAAGLRRRLVEAARDPVLGTAIEAEVARLNGTPGKHASFEPLHRLLEAQPYRLAFWRVAAEEINYRRFFQINDLAGIRIEVPAVFDQIHQLTLRLIGEGHIHGLRIDHIDGLFDPRRYLERLQEVASTAKREAIGQQDADHSGGDEKQPFYIVVEKILAPHERLREEWPIAGTTGYEFLNRVNGLFVDPEAESILERAYERFIGSRVTFEEITYQSKKQVMDLELASELRVLANEYNRLTESSWQTRDYTLVGLRQALREVVACFPVYRTYVDDTGASQEDYRDIEWAIAHARRRSYRPDKSVFDFIYQLLTAEIAEQNDGLDPAEVRRLAMKFQQYTGPVMAKGVEDTAFYRYNRLVSLNEVGGEPARFGTTLSAFHHLNQDAARRWPHRMVCSATHDTKRGEDVRARINVISELPDEWSARARRWATLNRRRKTDYNDAQAPDDNDEYLFYQTLVGAWPIEFAGDGEIDPDLADVFRDRMLGYMTKAIREAKRRSSWIAPDETYESSLNEFVTRVLDMRKPNPFVSDFRGFQERIAPVGMVYGLAQTTVKLTAPGVPDIYQGCEMWDFSLVDPDNRRPVDFEVRAAGLRDIRAALAEHGALATARRLLEHWQDGVVKLYLTWRLLGLRNRNPALFLHGGYAPADAVGPRGEHLCAFVRTCGGQSMLVVVPRLVAKIMDRLNGLPLGHPAWGDTAVVLPEEAQTEGVWVNVLTDEEHAVEVDAEGRISFAAGALLKRFPIAVLLGPDRQTA
ncbi:MAG: malto-oligosyltrehalose synthase [Rhodospirillales bacterium]|nr:malto-oligosyltrehalose synthase [Rhodospirillales bacterium]